MELSILPPLQWDTHDPEREGILNEDTSMACQLFAGRQAIEENDPTEGFGIALRHRKSGGPTLVS